jgi:uncharacterized membrane protein required for colicin V production
MTKVDLIAAGFVALTAFIGWKKGLVASALSLVGIVLGAWLGSRLAPSLLQGGKSSPYTPLAALAGAAVGAILLETLGTLAGASLRSRIHAPRLTTIDSAGGVALGAVAGLAIVWVLGAVALLLPGQADLRHGAQQSALLRRLNEVVSPEKVLNALARIDPFPAISGPAAPVAPPDPRLARAPGVRSAAPSVVRVLGTACGVGVEGTGWTARPDTVVTAAHVVAGQTDTVVELQSGGRLTAVRPQERRRRPARQRPRAPPAAARGPGRRHAGRGARLPGERPVHGDTGAYRADLDGARRGRLRARSCYTRDHVARRARAPRRFRRARGRRARGGRVHRVRRSLADRGRLRHPRRGCAAGARRRAWAGVDRRLRALGEGSGASKRARSKVVRQTAVRAKLARPLCGAV